MAEAFSFPLRPTPEQALAALNALRARGAVWGTDEAGRGPLAGPVAAAAVFLDEEQEARLLALGLRDSKKMTEKRREAVLEAMEAMGVPFCVCFASAERIDRDNILRASLWAMKQSVLALAERLGSGPVCLVVDGTALIPGLSFFQSPVVRADSLVPAVSAASVAAKVLRDRRMAELDVLYPGYGLARNKGYPTARHREAVRELGLSPVHRRTFCRKLLAERQNKGQTNREV